MHRFNRLIVLAVITGLCAAIARAEFKGDFQAAPYWTHTKTLGASSVRATFQPLLSWQHTDGTNANQMTSLAIATLSLTNGQAHRLSLATDLRDTFGDVVTLGRVRFFAVAAEGAGSGLHVGGGASAWTNWLNSASAAISVRPGGLACFIAPDLTGYPIGTATNLYLSNTGPSNCTATVYIGGSL